MTSGMTPEVILSLLSSPLGGWSRVSLTLKVIRVIYEYRIKSDKEQEGGAERGREREEGAGGRGRGAGKGEEGGTEKGRGEERGAEVGGEKRGMRGGGRGGGRRKQVEIPKNRFPQQPGVVRTILLLIDWGNEYLS